MINKGIQFEISVSKYLEANNSIVTKQYPVNICINSRISKVHKYDFGNNEIVVECKDYNWTKGHNYANSKISGINEVMLLFLGTPPKYTKKLFLRLTDKIGVNNPETIFEYYIRKYQHLIPSGIEIYELDPITMTVIMWKDGVFLTPCKTA